MRIEKLLQSKFAIIWPALFAMLLYAFTCNFSFSPLDEQWLIVTNTQSFDASGAFFSFFKQSIQGVFYRPLLMLSFYFNYLVGHADPLIYHLSNILFHALAVALLYTYLVKLKINKSASLCLSLLFACHPLAAHAVAWVPGRNDSLLAIFLLLALIHLVNYQTKHNSKYIIFHYASFFACLLTKETAIAFPLIFIALQKTESNIKKIAIAYLACIGLYWLMLVASKTAIPTFSLSTLSAMGWTLFASLTKLLLLYKLSVSCPVFIGSKFIGIAIIVLCTISLIWMHKKNSISAVYLLLSYLCVLLPAYFSVQSSVPVMDEHRLYIPLLAVIIVLGLQANQLPTKISGIVFAVLVSVYISVTLYRLPVYKTQKSFLQEACNDNPKNYFFKYQYANLLFYGNDYPAALEYCNAAILLQPNKAKLYALRGDIFCAISELEKGKNEFAKALSLAGESPAILELLPGITRYRQITTMRLHLIDSLLQTDSQDPSLYAMRAKVFLDANNKNAAIADANRALELSGHLKSYEEYLLQLENIND